MEEIFDISGEVLEIGDYVSLYKSNMMIGTIRRFSKKGGHVFIDLVWFPKFQRPRSPYERKYSVGEEVQTLGRNVFKFEFDMRDRLIRLKLTA